MPIGIPGWPLLAASTASIARARMALARRRWVGCIEAPLVGFGAAQDSGPVPRPLWKVSRWASMLAAARAFGVVHADARWAPFRSTRSRRARAAAHRTGAIEPPGERRPRRRASRQGARGGRGARRANPRGGGLMAALVDISIAGRTYQVACREGE